jgi:hypothetical protein
MDEANKKAALWPCRILSVLLALSAFAFGRAGHLVIALVLGVLATGLASAVALIQVPDLHRDRFASVAIGIASVTIYLAVLRLVGL